MLKTELYNLTNDPEETNNLTANDANRAKKMKAKLEDWQRSVIRSLNGEDY